MTQSAPSDQWHYTQNGQQYGPITFEALRQLAADGRLSAQDFVWHPSMTDWAAAQTVPGLMPTDPTGPAIPGAPVLGYGGGPQVSLNYFTPGIKPNYAHF